MITLILGLLVTLTFILLFAAAMFTIGVLDRLRGLLKTAALDWVQIYAAHHAARLDIETRREEIDFTVLNNTLRLEQQADYGKLLIAKHRQKLLSHQVKQ